MVIIGLLIIFIPIFLGMGIVFGIFYLLNKREFSPPRIRPVNDPETERVLLKYLPYYNGLGLDAREIFQGRMFALMESKNFVWRKSMKADKTQKIIISGILTQVLFGLNEYTLRHYKTIAVYPDRSEAKTGEPTGTIIVRWNEVEEYLSGKRSRHSLIYQLANMLRAGALGSNLRDQYFMIYIRKWMEEAAEVFRGSSSAHSLFKEAGAQNMNDFFAVCTEYFFTRPAALKAAHPALFNTTGILYNQDTSAPAGEMATSIREALLPDYLHDEAPEQIVLKPSPGQVINRISPALGLSILILLIQATLIDSLEAATSFFMLMTPIFVVALWPMLKNNSWHSFSANGITEHKYIPFPYRSRFFPYDRICTAELTWTDPPPSDSMLAELTEKAQGFYGLTIHFVNHRQPLKINHPFVSLGKDETEALCRFLKSGKTHLTVKGGWLVNSSVFYREIRT